MKSTGVLQAKLDKRRKHKTPTAQSLLYAVTQANDAPLHALCICWDLAPQAVRLLVSFMPVAQVASWHPSLLFLVVAVAWHEL